MLEIINGLSAHEANCNAIDHEGRAPLHYAVIQDSVHVVELPKKRGANLNASRDMGARPLHISAMFGNPTTVQWFLKQPGVDINKISAEGNSVMFRAARGRQERILQLLLISIHVHNDVKDRLGRSILHAFMSWAGSKLVDLNLADRIRGA